MTSTTTRRQATAARKAQIVQAAVALLAAHGHQATTFDAICEQAGLSSKRLITYHFCSKDELFAAIAEQVVADAEAFMRPALDAATGARETLTAVIRATVAFMATHLDEMRALQQIILNGGHAWDEPQRITTEFASLDWPWLNSSTAQGVRLIGSLDSASPRPT